MLDPLTWFDHFSGKNDRFIGLISSFIPEASPQSEMRTETLTFE